MYEEQKGKLLFNDPKRKFVFQESVIKTLTKNYDIQISTMGKNNEYLVAKIADKGVLKDDVFEKSTDSSDKFACAKIDYQDLEPSLLFSWVDILKGFYFCQKDKQQAYYNKVNGDFNEITKDEFFESNQ